MVVCDFVRCVGAGAGAFSALVALYQGGQSGWLESWMVGWLEGWRGGWLDGWMILDG